MHRLDAKSARTRGSLCSGRTVYSFDRKYISVPPIPGVCTEVRNSCSSLCIHSTLRGCRANTYISSVLHILENSSLNPLSKPHSPPTTISSSSLVVPLLPIPTAPTVPRPPTMPIFPPEPPPLPMAPQNTYHAYSPPEHPKVWLASGASRSQPADSLHSRRPGPAGGVSARTSRTPSPNAPSTRARFIALPPRPRPRAALPVGREDEDACGCWEGCWDARG